MVTESAIDIVQILAAQSHALDQVLLNSVLHNRIPPKFRLYGNLRFVCRSCRAVGTALFIQSNVYRIVKK